jgi:DNA-binding NarL/FixJ family response regulator
VLIADDNAAVRDALGALVKSDDEFQLVAVAADATEAIALAVSEQPDIALLDVRMPAGGGVEAARSIAERAPATKVVLLTASGIVPEGLNVEDIAGCVAKGSPPRDIVRAIKRATVDCHAAPEPSKTHDYPPPMGS